VGELLRYDQVRSLVRLVAEVKEIHRFDPAGPQHLIAGLNRIVGATAGGCVIDSDFVPEGRGSFRPAVLDGWEASTLRALTVLDSEGSSFSPLVRGLMQGCPPTAGAVFTATRQELVPDRSWYQDPYVCEHLLPTHLDHAIYSSARAASPNVVQGLGFHREKKDRPFDARDRALIQFFHAEYGALLPPQPAFGSSVGAQLAPRQRQVLELLVEGLADKEIAERLGISRHTVNQYTKQLYRRFGVTSRALLAARLRRGAP
jgi:DNA-binding CsgD family transcriptional regulator